MSDTPTAPPDADLPPAGARGMNQNGTRVVVEPHWLTLDAIGKWGRFAATVVDAVGDTVQSAQVSWASADTAIAKVDATGRVTAIAFGSTQVTASFDSASAEVTVEVAPPLTDREILEILFEAAGGDNWTNSTNWLTDRDLSEWYGVTAHEGRVRYLELRNNNLTGTIPPELGGLDNLFILYLSENRLSGTIPAELSKFTGIRDLSLSHNPDISGRLPPELGYTGGLEYFSIGSTRISGPVPLTFANLELTRFYFDRDGVCIPAALEAWLKAVPEKADSYQLCTSEMFIDPDSLYIEAPPLGDTARLTVAVINAEGDTVPDVTVTWASADTTIATVDSTGLVTSVDYGTTEVTAAVDSLTATAEVRVEFALSDRQVLDSLYRVTGGENWTDTTNWLSDEPLSEWAGVETSEAGKVVGLSLGGNNLTGSIPLVIGELGDLVTLDLSRNTLKGRIPGGLRRLAHLRDLLLYENVLEAPLPGELGHMAALRYLHIGSNRLTGVVPRSFGNLALDSLHAAGSGVCVPPSLNSWFDGISQTDEVDRCITSIAIEVVDQPSLNFYAIGETATLSATFVNAEGDSTEAVTATWTSGSTAVASVDAGGRVTARGDGSTEVTATYDSTTASIAVEVALPQNDRDVLAILHDRTYGGSWTDGTNWLSDEPLSDWGGVDTDDNGRVVGLSLNGNNLRGPIHSSIGQLDQLRTLNLGRNWISGSIPAEVRDLSLLRQLVLSVNGLDGELPAELGHLDSLRTLNVGATSLSGLIPGSFADLDLESFQVNGTELCVPPSLSAWLDSIPQTDDPPECTGQVSVDPTTVTLGAIGDTVRLAATVIGPDGAVVQSPALTWTSGDTRVARIDTTGLVTARYVGVTTITATYDSVTAGSVEVAVKLPGSDRVVLETFYRATGGRNWTDNTNWLSDEPLEEWHGVGVDGSGRVNYLSLRDNNLTGQIPQAIGLLDSLLTLTLGYNPLTGPIPSAIGRLRGLRNLVLRNTGLSGPLPPEMGDMKELQYVSLDNTALSGPLPATLANLTVSRFYHSGTGLCVPRSLADWYASVGNDDPLPCIPETADRDVLFSLYNETGGSKWHDQTNWLSEHGLNTWRGIVTDEEGYVTEIFMPWNNLTDSIPPELGNLARLEVLSLYGNGLTGRIPPELGKLSRVRDFSLSGNKLEGPIPPELGGLVSVDTMYLAGNRLSGPIPPEFGNLVALEHLAIFENELSGPLPAELGNLKKLKNFWAVDNKFEGPLPPELGDMTSLEDLSLSRNEITGPLPPELGRLPVLKYLRIPDNKLSGPIPPELGSLASLQEIYLMRNELSGSLPPELGKLSKLETLWIFANQLTGPIPAELGNLSGLKDLSIGTNELTGSIPPELGKLSALEGMFLMRNNLTGPIPPELGDLSNLETLWLFLNELSGSIPAELGNLSALESLSVGDNRLSGSIPPELGQLTSLEVLGVRNNKLAGSIPPELGQLTALTYLSLRNNNLSGQLPPELGNLINLEDFTVYNNMGLEGLMPRSMMNLPLGYLDISSTYVCPHLDDEFQEWLDGIGRAYGLSCPPTLTERFALEEVYAAADGDSWTSSTGWNSESAVRSWHGVTVSRRDTLVRKLELPANGLQGNIAPAIANLQKLETLDLGDNSLTGDIPVAITSMDALDTIRISGNAGMQGPLPFHMTTMTELKALQYANTGLCASPSATFQTWIDGLDLAQGATCGNPEEVRLSLPMAYLTQAIQRPAGDVPLLSGRDAFLRVFLAGDQANAFFEPEVVATLTRGGEEVHRVVMRQVEDRLVTAPDEGKLGTSYNAVIPAEHIVAGTELVVVADSAGTVPRAEGSQTRFPATGTMKLDVIDVPPLELTVVPLLYAENPDSSVFEWTDDIDEDSPQLGLFRHSFPFSEISVRDREPHVTSLDLTEEDNAWFVVLELERVYRAEEATGYWYGVGDSQEGYVRGIARLNGWISIGKPWDTELAHEVGHTLDLKHAPCGGALGTDPDYPYSNGSIGVWGFDFRDSTVVSPDRRRDIMGYCYERGWLSDYYFEKVIRVREEKEGEVAQDRARVLAAEPKREMLVLWGGVLNGELRILPVHSMNATPALPDRAGPYRIEGFAQDGDAEFSLSFTPGEDVYGNKYFFFTIPIEADWEDTLDRVTLTGPEGEVTVDNSDPRTMTVVTDPGTGRVRAILRDWQGPLPDILGDVTGLEIESTTGLMEPTPLRR